MMQTDRREVENLHVLHNRKFLMKFNDRGTVYSLRMNDDPTGMNWVVDPGYLMEAGYREEDKLFGEWEAVIDGKTFSSSQHLPKAEQEGNSVNVQYSIEDLDVAMEYNFGLDDAVVWTIRCRNKANRTVRLDGFHVWMSLAYMMFRDLNVQRNMNESCAVFPHLGGDFAKFAAIRRSNRAPHLGIYSIRGSVASLGTWCAYENRFLEQISPSLDGVLFHRLSLVENGRTMPELVQADWIYRDAYQSALMAEGESLVWEFVIAACDDREDFYAQSQRHGHPRWDYTPVLVQGGRFEGRLTLPDQAAIDCVIIRRIDREGRVIEEDVTDCMHPIPDSTGDYMFSIEQHDPGERVLELTMTDGKKDMVVWNVLEPIDRILDRRVEWLCSNSYDEQGHSGRPHAFLPLSNQGESLGKLNLILMKNSLSSPAADQIRKVEMAAVHDVRNHWFESGDFRRPRVLYGSFYRVYDFDYIGHLFYLLSKMDASVLRLNSPRTYREWAAELLCVRLDPDAHEGEREKDESGLNGVFILYIQDLLEDLREAGQDNLYDRLNALWNKFAARMADEAAGYRGAMTEHFYDNAGFGPTCEALCRIGLTEEAGRYGELILANIGFSNDYRAQNPDRWWEALTYMIHSLWGGLVAASARVAYEHLGDPAYLEAAYRATMAVFHCYDWNVRSTPRRLSPGEAASTYSVSAPNLNMTALSRNRFGQSVFRQADDPLFSRLFANASGDDWDMGEELVAYLLGFGTTTYLYSDESGTLRCVNGFVTKQEDGWLVTSYAAYPKKYVLLEKQAVYETEDGESARQVLLRNGQFEPAATAM